MLRDITLGQYYPSDSVIHKMDPRVKLFGTIVFIISLFLFQKINTVSGCCDHDLKSAVFFYGQRIEGDFCADDDHRCV